MHGIIKSISMLKKLNNLNLFENIAKYLKYIENIKSLSAHTLSSYRGDLEQAFGKINSKEVTEAELLKECKKAQKRWAPLTPASRNRKASVLKSFLHWLSDQEMTVQNLAHQVHAPKVPKKIPHFLSVDEVLSVVQTLNDKEKQNLDPKLANQQKILFYLLYGCGLRVSEACQLRWDNCNFTKQTLTIMGKGDKQRLIAGPAIVFELLKKYRDSHSLEFVFENQPFDRRKAYELIRLAGIAAGLMKPLHPHSLRHSYATHLLTSGADLRILQELLGHATMSATEKYTHLSTDHLARTLSSKHPLK